MPSESFYLKVVAMPLAGLGAIYLTAMGLIAPEAGTAILSGIACFAIGEANGIKKAGVQ